jgi:hypothetical protein
MRRAAPDVCVDGCRPATGVEGLDMAFSCAYALKAGQKIRDAKEATRRGR